MMTTTLKNTGGVSIEDHPDTDFVMSCESIEIELDLKFHSRGEGYTIKKNRIVVSYNLHESVEGEFEFVSNFDLEMIVNHRRKTFHFSTESEDSAIFPAVDEILPMKFVKAASEVKPLLGQSFLGLLLPSGQDILSDISVFDFTPKDIKCSSPIVGKLDLDENAKNLPVVLKNILKNKDNRKRLVNLVSDLLPFVEDLKVTETVERSLIIEIKETFSKDKFLPSTLLSDGTAHATALITALYFDASSKIKVFEEPERNMHPALVCKLIEHMKSYASNSQVIVTTHNTELLRNAEPEDVLFISRQPCGSSQIERLSNREDVKTFLENEIGIDELYSNNLLAGY